VNEERHELAQKLRVGLFVVVSLLAFLGMIYALGARARLFEARYTIHAEFPEVGGLVEGATVRLAGVQIGRVSGVHLPARAGGKVRVDLNIAKQFADRVRRDSMARIETQGLLGDKIVEISVGTAEAPPTQSGDTIAAQAPSDLAQVVAEGLRAARTVAELAASLKETTDALKRSRLIEEGAATLAGARRVVEQVERGRGLAHALLYDEPVALRRLDAALASLGALLDRVERGEGAAGVLASRESTAAARRFVAALDRLGRVVERPGPDDGLLPGLLFDPQYRTVLEDLRVVAKNFRDVSERVAGGRGALGALVREDDSDLRRIALDVQAAAANLRAISERLEAGEGTLGALLADPTVYERLVNVLDSTQRSFLLRSLLRGLASPKEGAEP
jgi:phospholipid/cholesterol/gamma-HCH transport system substrate-binding protein